MSSHADSRRISARLLPGDGWAKVASGESQTDVYKRGDTYAKVSDEYGTLDLAGERERVLWLANTGIPTAQFLDWLEGPDGAVLLTTEVQGICGSELQGSLELLRSLTHALRLFHDLPVQDCPFRRETQEVLSLARDVVRRGAVNYDFIDPGLRHLAPEELLSRLLGFDSRKEDLVVCHGDATLANLLFDPETQQFSGAIDVGRLGVANRYSDLALASSQVVSHGWSGDAETFFSLYGLDGVDHEQLEFFGLLDAMSWG